MSFTYLASPYSHDDPLVREKRYLAALEVVHDQFLLSHWIYSPIVHCHEMAKVFEVKKPSADWRAYNFAMLKAATRLWVLKLPGWQDSTGVQDEMLYAEALQMPIVLIPEDSPL